jgi:aspartate 1-decarboxylase
MLFEVLKSKIHMAIVTEANVEYDGSITIDEKLARKADISPNEKVLVSDVETETVLKLMLFMVKKERFV